LYDFQYPGAKFPRKHFGVNDFFLGPPVAIEMVPFPDGCRALLGETEEWATVI